MGRRAGVRRVELDDENKSAHVVVPDDKLSLAIGQRGQNARLAARLTGWKVDIKGESEATVSINELFKPEEPEADEATELMLDNPEERTDENSEEQTADTPDPIEVEDVEVEASETPEAEESLLIRSEENIETLDVTAENEDLDPESE